MLLEITPILIDQAAISAALAAYEDSLTDDAEHRIECRDGCRLFGPPRCEVARKHQSVIAIRESALNCARRGEAA